MITPTCDKIKPCPTGFLCEDSVCEKLCDDNSQCADTQICRLDICTTNCSMVRFLYVYGHQLSMEICNCNGGGSN